MEQLAGDELPVPGFLANALRAMAEPLNGVQRAIRAIEAEILAWHRQDRDSRRLADAPGFRVTVASAIATGLTDPKAFRTGRDFAASLGVTPMVESTGRKPRLGRISKRGDRYLRRLLINGAQALLLSKRAQADPWITKLLATKPRKLAAVAAASKMARMAWAMIALDQDYRPKTFAAA